jgi:hypothetical protein
MTHKVIAIKPEQVERVLNHIPHSAIFSITFIKKDQSVRDMNCRRGVIKHLTPNPKREKPVMPSNYVTVYDLHAKGYRHINIDTTLRISARGRVFEVMK